ncbi:DUF4190 domain-containing protein [Mycolicibacterium mengxianglii]|uniref:DUF4190 domain-containing protein n=1 Tax=Mycolicibacterium mengxianglii TaxID=2736649 RepID=UPI0018D1D59D|nr:DUF4190 domain-containing protein [Mycolicibacterium mengxianglii]
MTNPEPPPRGVEHPTTEHSSPPQADPYAPVDYPANYPGYDAPPPNGYPAQYSQPYPPPQPFPTGYPGNPPGYPPAYPGYNPYDPYGQGKPPGTNGKAIAALVTAVGGLVLCGLPSIAGIILGIIAMRETKRTGQDGYGLALAGLIVGSLVVLLGILYIVFIVVIASNSSTYPTY